VNIYRLLAVTKLAVFRLSVDADVLAVHCQCSAAAVEKEQQDYQRNRRLSAVDLSRGALKPGGLKEKVIHCALSNYTALITVARFIIVYYAS